MASWFCLILKLISIFIGVSQQSCEKYMLGTTEAAYDDNATRSNNVTTTKLATFESSYTSKELLEAPKKLPDLSAPLHLDKPPEAPVSNLPKNKKKQPLNPNPNKKLPISENLASLSPPLSKDSIKPNTDAIVDNPLLRFTRAYQSINVERVGDDFDETTQQLIAENFGIDNEDKWLNSVQLISKCGYKVQQYTIKSPDGYLLSMIRIIPKVEDALAVFIMHGLFSSSDDILTSGCDKSLPFVISDAGYDVWLGNARGNKYSKRHESLSADTDKEFWNFSWHEIGVIDAPTMIDFILDETGWDDLFYIGHSQGTTMMFVLLTEKPEYNDKIKLMVALSPIAWMSNMFCPLLRVFSQFVDDADFLDQAFGSGEFQLNSEFSAAIQSIACGTSAAAVAVCSPFYSSLSGFNPEGINFTNYPVQSYHYPSSSSSKQVVHYLQEIKSGKFRQFDYGEKQNEMRYGRSTPPEYDVSKITSDVAIFYSDNDWLSSPIDVNKLTSQLPNLRFIHRVQFPLNHQDYIWGKNAFKLVYSKIINLFLKY